MFIQWNVLHASYLQLIKQSRTLNINYEITQKVTKHLNIAQ